ncbi:hypothetical protein OsI_19567 [Oryza sativa Indica Group]|uniref:Uncharacterized protein n=1 Tax=Oryza sativa subsp. indica TaxID=39946 RepID=B8AX14_ORYSI|nr:hypothetical protein OsI_19567 [Oryza sativa Indica Group]
MTARFPFPYPLLLLTARCVRDSGGDGGGRTDPIPSRRRASRDRAVAGTREGGAACSRLGAEGEVGRRLHWRRTGSGGRARLGRWLERGRKEVAAQLRRLRCLVAAVADVLAKLRTPTSCPVCSNVLLTESFQIDCLRIDDSGQDGVMDQQLQARRGS